MSFFSDFIDRLKKRKKIDRREKRGGGGEKRKKEQGEDKRIIYDVGQSTDSAKVQTKNGQTCEKLAATTSSTRLLSLASDSHREEILHGNGGWQLAAAGRKWRGNAPLPRTVAKERGEGGKERARHRGIY